MKRLEAKNFNVARSLGKKGLQKQQNLSVSKKIEFVELLGRSHFSFLQGASSPEEMILQAIQLGYKGFGLCDLNGVYGVARAYQALHAPSQFTISQIFKTPWIQDQFSYHVGCEFQTNSLESFAAYPMSAEGYTVLCQWITDSKRLSPKGYSCLSWEKILRSPEDLILCPLPPWNKERLRELLKSWGDRIYLPVWRDYSWESIKFYQQALELEESLGISLFATQRPFMHIPERKPLFDVMTCILHGTTLDQAQLKLSLNSERHLRPLHDVALIWKSRPDLLERTVEISKRLHFQLSDLSYQYPELSRPEGLSPSAYLHDLCEKGLQFRYPRGVPTKARNLLNYELKTIQELKYEDYFLTIWDICEFAKSKAILHQGRGSAANSVVCFALGLTSIDPVNFELMFERFISKERGEPPDIDIDFESGRREEVIQYIFQKYGAAHAAMVSTTICYRAKMALRETAKTFGISSTLVTQIVKLMGREGLKDPLEYENKAEEMGIPRKKFTLWIKLAYELQGAPRHLGIHSGGFVISKNPIVNSVPVEKATMPDRYVIQWNKDDVNFLKIMKIDVLGLGMLSAVQKSLQLLSQKKNLHYNMATIPAEDAETYKMIQKADTVGVFQIESRAQMSLLPRLKPKTFYDLVISVAIVRPGPIQGGMVHPFLKRRDGLEKPTFAHPDLRDVLGRTLGVPIFQEQTMQIAAKVCGFTPGEADELRRIMSSSWTKKEVMEGLRQRLLNGMLSHGISRQDAEVIYRTIKGFASYGFPESHAASFALITYVSCYLKRHHPDVFTCSLLNSQPMGFYSPRSLIADAQRHQVNFLPLCIQNSEWDYTLAEPFLAADVAHQNPSPLPVASSIFYIRQGFRSLYSVREAHIQKLVAERNKSAFAGLSDFIKRTQLPKFTLLILAAANAFSCFGIEGRAALWKIQGMDLDHQSLLWGMEEEQISSTADSATSDSSFLPEETHWEFAQREYQAQGFSVSSHPLSLLRSGLTEASKKYLHHKQLPFSSSKDLIQIQDQKKIRFAGLMTIQQRPPTAKGFCFLTLEDEWGFFNVILAPDVYSQVRLELTKSPFLEIFGLVEKKSGVTNIKAQALRALPLDQILNLGEISSTKKNSPSHKKRKVLSENSKSEQESFPEEPQTP